MAALQHPARAGCKEPRIWVRKQPGFSHSVTEAIQPCSVSNSIVMNWHFMMEKKKSTLPRSSFAESAASTRWSQVVFEKSLAFSGVQN